MLMSRINRAALLAIILGVSLPFALTGCGSDSGGERVAPDAGVARGANGPIYKEDPASKAAGGSGLPVGNAPK